MFVVFYGVFVLCSVVGLLFLVCRSFLFLSLCLLCCILCRVGVFPLLLGVVLSGCLHISELGMSFTLFGGGFAGVVVSPPP